MRELLCEGYVSCCFAVCMTMDAPHSVGCTQELLVVIPYRPCGVR